MFFKQAISVYRRACFSVRTAANGISPIAVSTTREKPIIIKRVFQCQNPLFFMEYNYIKITGYITPFFTNVFYAAPPTSPKEQNGVLRNRAAQKSFLCNIMQHSCKDMFSRLIQTRAVPKSSTALEYNIYSLFRLIEHMITDYNSLTAVISAEMGNISHIGNTCQRFLCGLNAA